jgi:hypothetical protein
MRKVTIMAVMLGAGLATLHAGEADGGGPATLELLLEERRAALAAGATDVSALEARIDAVAGQKDAAFSRLYWHRDREAARRAAVAARRPIVTLRLLGDLSCDRSCANSRFFRTALYANERVSRLLRERAVLHWESVRPVPLITIDMGDGRKLERTITGNSVHYVLTPEGEVVDVLPGLYGPEAFLAALERSLAVAERVAALPSDQRGPVLRRLQGVLATQLEREALTARLGAGLPPPVGRPTAREAAAITGSKMGVEMPMIGALDGAGVADLDDAAWRAIAEQRPTRLDARSRALMARKLRDPADLDRVAARFEQRMALDTVKNDLQLRPRALAWLAKGEVTDLDALNRRVYAELFLTPEDDPWLGLDAPGEYSGLDGDGLR